MRGVGPVKQVALKTDFSRLKDHVVQDYEAAECLLTDRTLKLAAIVNLAADEAYNDAGTNDLKAEEDPESVPHCH